MISGHVISKNTTFASVVQNPFLMGHSCGFVKALTGSLLCSKNPERNQFRNLVPAGEKEVTMLLE